MNNLALLHLLIIKNINTDLVNTIIAQKKKSTGTQKTVGKGTQKMQMKFDIAIDI